MLGSPLGSVYTYREFVGVQRSSMAPSVLHCAHVLKGSLENPSRASFAGYSIRVSVTGHCPQKSRTRNDRQAFRDRSLRFQ